ncbi:MAG: hypothetical protein ACTS5I_07145 [Rhodanobacter sp.]
MPKLIVQYVDSLFIERIQMLARERCCSNNDVVLGALRRGLGISSAQQYSEGRHEPQALNALNGDWEAAEQAIFDDALQALAQTRATQLAPETIGYDEPVRGAE